MAATRKIIRAGGINRHCIIAPISCILALVLLEGAVKSLAEV